jgi:hypothetical protein
MKRIGSKENVMKFGLCYLSVGVIFVVPFGIGCGGATSPITGGSSTVTTSSGSGTITSSGSGSQMYVPAYPIAASTLYVIQNDPTTGASSVLELPATGHGSVTPAATLVAPPNTTFQQVAVDRSGNIYAGAQTTVPTTMNEVLVYAPGATGSSVPVRTITYLQNLVDVKADMWGQVYVLQGDSTAGGTTISEFASGATGNATPLSSISGSLTMLDHAAALTWDLAGDMCVANSNGNNILIFAWPASGNVAPQTIIGGSATGILKPRGIAVDLAGNILVTATSVSSAAPVILEFAHGASGNVAPTKTWAFVAPYTGIAVDNANNVFAVTNSNGQPEVDGFPESQTGGASPSQTMASTAWTNSQYQQLAFY